MRALLMSLASGICLLLTAITPAKADHDAIWTALKSGGHVALMRHARAPGFGDPENFSVNEPTTQRNLSDDGREQARRISAAFIQHAIPYAQVYASQWRRCMETAELLDLGPVTPAPILNSFFQNQGASETQTAALRKWLQSANLHRPIILVTHQVNITALTGVYPASGEIVVIRRMPDGTIAVIGRELIK